MKIGFGTVLWGRRIDDLEYALDVIAACGYKGVEFAQHHEEIFVRCGDEGRIRPVSGIEELLDLMDARGLELLGLVSGTLAERISFLGQITAPYLYLDRWPEEEAREALEAGYTLAIHPHWLMPIRRTAQARKKINEFSKKYPGKVRLIVDTAHALIAEDDPVKDVRSNSAHLASVHVKSWRPDYGRWSHRYAHGFCPPGEGIVPVEEVLDALHATKFDGWIVMEQDHYEARRELTALRCAKWLRKHGDRWGLRVDIQQDFFDSLIQRKQFNPHFEEIAQAGVEKWALDAINGRHLDERLFKEPFTATALSAPLSELLLGRELSRRVSHRPEPVDFYRIISEKVRELLDADCVKVWSYNPLIGEEGEFCLLGLSAPKYEQVMWKTIIEEPDSFAGSTLSHPRIWQYDLREPQIASSFCDKEWLQEFQESTPWFVVLPVFNTSNTHHLRYLIAITRKTPLLVPDGVGCYDREASMDRLGQLDALSWIVAHWGDYFTDEICSAASGYTNHLCGNLKQSVTDFIDSLRDFLQATFDCNQVTIFLEDITRKRLKPAGNSIDRLNWTSLPHYYSHEDYQTLTYRAWKAREMVFSSSAREGRAREKRPEDDQRDEILFAPLARRDGPCHGVVRLHNKKRLDESISSMFTDDDAAKLDAIIQAALPHLELLKLQEQQTQSLARMMHEFQTPLVAIRGAVDLMQTDLRKRKEDPSRFFKRDFLDDVLQWTELMGRLTQNARMFAVGSQTETLRPKKISLLADVVMPALRQIRPLVPDGVRFHSSSEDLGLIPHLWLDRNQMQQVFFNLLSNSIKYGGSSQSIRVRITGGPVGKGYSVFFEDWGSGIDEADREEIFQPGFRSEKAALSDVSGLGLGCFVIRALVEAHGGSINVRSCRNPTTFEIILPQYLRYRKPVIATESDTQ